MKLTPTPLAYAEAPVVDGVRSRFVDTATGLRMHLLEAGTPGRPVVLLLHGFPELAYSWRHQLPALAAAGYHVIAPDQRGYGRTTGWDGRFEADLAPYRLFNLAKDALALVRALGLTDVAAVIGHDFGSFVAGCCALMRPDVFRGRGTHERAVQRRTAAECGVTLSMCRPPLQRSTRHGSTTNGTTRRRRRIWTCTTHREACTPSCAPTTT